MRSEEGSVLLWTLGLFIVTASVVVTLVAFLSAAATQRELQALADSSALAASNQLDTAKFLETGVISDVAVDPAAARTVIQRLLSRSPLTANIDSLQVEQMTVRLTLSTDWQLFSAGRTLTATSTVIAEPQDF